MLIARLAVAASAMLVLAGCGVGPSSELAQPSRTATPSAAAAERSEHQVPDSTRTSLGDGLTLTVAPPKSFTPTETAYPKAGRAVAFEMTIDNDGAIAYRPASLSFTATVNGQETEQVIDSTQGYTGTSGAPDEAEPSTSVHFAVAFAVTGEPCRMTLTVRPDPAGAAPILLYEGMV